MKKLLVAFAVLFAAGVSRAEDLEISSGSVYDLPATATYDTVVVHGTLNIPSGVKLTATNVSLGPDAGDSAVINVLGNAESSLKVTGKVTVGENGGTGRIVALNDAASYGTVVLSVPTLTVSAAAAAHDTGFIDVLEMGKMSVPVSGKVDGVDHSGWANKSSTKTVRLRIRGGRIGKNQVWSKTLFTGAFQIEGYDGQNAITFYNEWGTYTVCNGAMTVKPLQQDVIFDLYSNDGDNYLVKLGSNLTWSGVNNIVLMGHAHLNIPADDALPYGSGTGLLKVSAANAWLDLGSRTQRLNGLDAASGPTKEKGGAVRGDGSSRLIFGSGDIDGTLRGHVQAAVSVEKTGSGTLTVNGATSCGALTVSGGRLLVKSTLDVETLDLSEGAKLVIDGATVTASSGACVLGTLELQNGGRFVAHSVVRSDDYVRTEGYTSYTSLTKEGAGTYVMADPRAVAPLVRVREGVLALTGGFDLPDLTVQVDGGAVLDLSAVTGSRTVGGIVVDVSQGGGVLSNATLAAAGTIELANMTQSLPGQGIDFDFADSTGVVNLADWSVTCDGYPIPGLRPVYDATEKRLVIPLGYYHVTESGEGSALTGEMTTVVDVDPDVTYTNVAALTGSGLVLKRGAGSLVCAASSSGFAGDIVLESGMLLGPATDAFGTGTVRVTCSTSATAQVRLGSAAADTSYGCDFVFAGDSSDSHPALYFVTQTQKKTAVNGSVTALGYLAVSDDGRDASQLLELVSFNGPLTAVGQTVSYPTDNQTTFAGPVKAGRLRGSARYPRMGRFILKSAENEIGMIELDYINCSASAGALGGAALHLTGNNGETSRGVFSVAGDETIGWVESDSREIAAKNVALADSVSSAATLTMTGGTSTAWCQLALKDGRKAKLSLVVNAGNDDFVQIFSNSTWTASGDLIVSNGTLRLSGATTAPGVRNLVVAGGAFELESTDANALSNVTSVALSAAATMRFAADSPGVLNEELALTMETGARLRLPEGAVMRAQWAQYGGQRVVAGDYTGVGGVSAARVVPWIEGGGVLHVMTGCGMTVILR